jgi:hypothetical protein
VQECPDRFQIADFGFSLLRSRLISRRQVVEDRM